MAVDTAVYSPQQFSFHFIKEAALGTAVVTSMQKMNVDDIVTFQTETIFDTPVRSGSAGMVADADDMFFSQKAQPTTITVPFIWDSTVGQPLLENVMGEVQDTSPTDVSLASNYTPSEQAHGAAPTPGASNLGSFTVAIISPEAAESIAIPGCVVEELTLTADMGTESGRFHGTVVFKTGYRPADGTTLASAPSAYGASTTWRYLTEMTSKVINSVDVVLNKVEIKINNPLIPIGYQGTYGEPEMYFRGPEVSATGTFGIKYDSNTAPLWELRRAATACTVAIGDNATWASVSNAGILAPYGRIMSDVTPAGVNGAVFQDLAIKFLGDGSNDCLSIVL